MREFNISRDKLITALFGGNFRFRYGWIENFGEYNHKHIFIIGEKTDGYGIPVIEEVIRGQRAGELRIWYADIEASEVDRTMINVPYEYPLPLSPVTLAYDGNKYLYVIYNKYNIWRLDLKGVLNDPSGNWWMRLPPCLDCNFLGDTRTDEIWSTYFIKPNYLALLSIDGELARMDTETFVWFLDKQSPPEQAYTINNDREDSIFDKNIKKLIETNFNDLNDKIQMPNGNKLSPPQNDEYSPIMTVQGLDNDEVYMCNFGGIGGKVMNVYDKQWDNFYFDTRICSGAVKYFQKVIDKGLFPMFVKRRRLYTTNEIGHVFYAWLRIYGIYDIEFQLNDFYNGNEIRIYVDYTTINNWQNFEVDVYTINQGWVSIDSSNFTPQILENDWLWDSEYTRQYVKFIPTPDGQVNYRYSKIPPIYLSIDISSLNASISKIRVKYKPKAEEYNYISRINRVELISTQTELNVYDSSSSNTPLDIVRLEPIDTSQDYSMDFGVWIRNNSDNTVKDVKVYVIDNEWLDMTLDHNDDTSWRLYDQNNPLSLGDIDPHNEVVVYVRGRNLDNLPRAQDLTIIGIYPYSI